MVETPLGYSNLSEEEWKAVRTLADGRNIVIKKAERVCVLLCGTDTTILQRQKVS